MKHRRRLVLSRLVPAAPWSALHSPPHAWLSPLCLPAACLWLPVQPVHLAVGHVQLLARLHVPSPPNHDTEGRAAQPLHHPPAPGRWWVVPGGGHLEVQVGGSW